MFCFRKFHRLDWTEKYIFTRWNHALNMNEVAGDDKEHLTVVSRDSLQLCDGLTLAPCLCSISLSLLGSSARSRLLLCVDCQSSSALPSGSLNKFRVYN